MEHKKIISLICAAVLMFSLTAACSKDAESDEQINTGTNNGGEQTTADDSADNNPVTKLELPDGFIYHRGFAYGGNVLYVVGQEKDSGVDVVSIYAVSLDTGTASRVYSAPITEKNVNYIDVDADLNLWVLENSSDYYFEYDGYLTDTEETQKLMRLSASDEVDSELDISQIITLPRMAGGILIYDGKIIMKCFTPPPYEDMPYIHELVAIDFAGNILLEMDLSYFTGNVAKSADGIVLDAYGGVVSLFDLDEQSFDDILLMSDIVGVGADFSRAYISPEAFFINDGIGLYRYDIRAESAEKLFDWAGLGLSGTIPMELYALSNGDILYCGFNDVYIISTDRAQASEGSAAQAGRETLVLATFDSNLKSDVQAFNASNSNYKIELIDYSVHNIDIGSSEGLAKLRTEIVAGNVPDIIDLRNIPYDMYETGGLLADLMPFLDNDSEFGVSDCEPAVLSAMMENGKLYHFTPEFSVAAILGNRADIDRLGSSYSFSDLTALVENREFSSTRTRSQIIRLALGSSNSKFFDFNTGKCYFDTDDFVDFLEFCKTQTDDEMEIIDRFLPTSSFHICLMGSGGIQSFRHWFTGDDIGLAGLPSSGGGALLIDGSPYPSFGMSVLSEHKDGVWEFMKFIASDEYYAHSRIQGFPGPFNIRRSVNEKNEQLYRNRIVDGQIDGMPADESDIVLAREILDSVTGMYRFNEGLYNIVMEDASAFFAGAITAEQAAGYIQSKASIYMGERR